eukprot:gnl/TRDRNA2_/TRDRNA2_171286_c0_seq3.p1 gnl/TRDRNA2_/TRDRNA2_171286_c0~~gnl/TRDRNA2_/TRDRNA2_171286_c0_seq3.p1  ORF type:complete len:372 (-),score=64.28 gnl/TRDRNA2_/TRDRNA2_171286_c0_seq3:199-1221(-)
MTVVASAVPTLPLFLFTCCLYTVEKFCINTMFISFLCRLVMGQGGGGGMALLSMLFEIYMLMAYFPPREKELGSFTFLCWQMLVSGCVNALFLIIMFVLKHVGGDEAAMYEVYPNQGMWPMIMVCIALRSLDDPTGSTSFWGIMQIPNKWYPVAIACFFSLMSMRILWEVVAATIVGYMYSRMRIERFLPSKSRTNRLEQRMCTEHRLCLGGTWITAMNTPGFDLEVGDRRYATLSDFGRAGAGDRELSSNPREGSSSSTQNFTAFSGHGNRLGDGSEAAAFVVSSPAAAGVANSAAPERSTANSAALAAAEARAAAAPAVPGEVEMRSSESGRPQQQST